MTEHIIKDLKEMEKFAKSIAPQIKRGSIIFLTGDVGSGKTTLTRFVLKALKVKVPVTSPTFSLVNVYKNSKIGTINHFDLYRIEEIEELREIGFDEMLNGTTNFIEWPELVEEKLKNVGRIHIEKIGDTQRTVKINLIGGAI